MTDDAPTAADYAAWSQPDLSNRGWPEISVRRGGIRYPRIGMNHTVKREGWRRWFVQAQFYGDEMLHRFGPFTDRKQARQVQAALVQLHRQMDYLYIYRTDAERQANR